MNLLLLHFGNDNLRAIASRWNADFNATFDGLEPIVDGSHKIAMKHVLYLLVRSQVEARNVLEKGQVMTSYTRFTISDM